MKLINKEIFIPETNGQGVFPGFVTYISKDNPILMHRFGWVDASDTFDNFHDQISRDNGRTWSDPELRLKSHLVEGGKLRYAENSAFFDPDRQKLLTFTTKTVYPNDQLNSDAHWQIEINSFDPATGLWGQPTDHDFNIPYGTQMSFCFPIKTTTRRILLPTSQQQLDENGNPLLYKGSWATARKTLTAIGEYQSDGTLKWHAGKPASIDLKKSCRGLFESAIVELSNGRIAMVSRGSNEIYHDRPSYKWLCLSDDQGESWSEPAPLPCDTGELLESPSSGSTLFRSIKNGKIYWIGNLYYEGQHAQGNLPRSPLVIVEVQENPFTLIRESITVIDQIGNNDSPETQLSNFRYYQDRETGKIILFLTRFGEQDGTNWRQANYYRYEIEL